MIKRLFRSVLFMSIAILLVACRLDLPTKNTDPQIDYLPLQILTINDLHGAIEQDKNGRGGLSNLAYLINTIRNENELDDVILVANGDMFQGTAISNMTRGLSVIEAMNLMQFDFMGIGNHEFDWGIEEILKYFDHDESNGEANFPLLNANIFKHADNRLLLPDNSNVHDSLIIEREGVKIGIISYIGDVYDSISQDMVQDYYFDLNIKEDVKQRATEMRKNGVDIVLVNIHGGYANDILRYYYNQDLAKLKDNSGRYLVDAVINGHTHTVQVGAIERSNGVAMPVIQAGAEGGNLGKITLNFDMKARKVVDYKVDMISVGAANQNFDAKVEKVVSDYQAELGVNKTLAMAGETVYYRSNLYNWVTNVMNAATGADIAISNTGGVRSTGNIKKGEPVTLSQMYKIVPFDNNIFIVEATLAQIQSLLNSDYYFYSVAPGVTLNNDQTYKVAIISYVYTSKYLEDLRSEHDVETPLIVRELLIEDLKMKHQNGELFKPNNNPAATITKQLND